MGCTFKLTPRILLFLCWIFVVNSAQECQVTCSLGEYCSVDKCLECPPRTYQKEPVHFFTSCIPWTDKPPQSHYIIVKPGTSESDVEWSCEDGYWEKEYTVGSSECRRTITTASPVSSTTEPISVSLHTKQHSGNDNTAAIAGGVVGGVLSIILIGVIILYCKRMLCFAKWRLHVADGSTPHSVVFTERKGMLDDTEKDPV